MPLLARWLRDVEDRDRRGLRPRAGGRRDGEQRHERARRLAAAADRRVDVVDDLAAVGGDEVGDLRGVEARAAADAHEAVEAARDRGVGRDLEGLVARLDADVREDVDVDALGPSCATTRSVTPAATTPGSLQSIARVTPSRLSSQPASATAPGPNLIGVASMVKTVSWAGRAGSRSPVACYRPPRRAGRA